MALGSPFALGFSSFGGTSHGSYRKTLSNMFGLVGLLALPLKHWAGFTTGPF